MSHTAAEHTAAGAEHTVAGRTEFENTAAADSKFVATEHTAVEHTVAAHTVAAHTAAAASADIDPADTDSADTEIDHIAADCTHQIADLHKIARFEKNFQHYKNYCSRY